MKIDHVSGCGCGCDCSLALDYRVFAEEVDLLGEGGVVCGHVSSILASWHFWLSAVLYG